MTSMSPQDTQPVSASLRISDYHLGSGSLLPDGTPNLKEDFKGDEDYASMLAAFQARYPRGTPLSLEWAGDMIDFHAIPFRGRCGSLPTLEAALEKIEACLKGHPRFWEATREFLAADGRALDLTIGNHDFELAWPEVQSRLRKFFGADAARVRFVTTVIDGDTCKLHGDFFDPLNANPPSDQWFIVEKHDGGEKKFLNIPYGTVMNASLGQALKSRRPWIGRMRNLGPALILVIAKDWYFGLSAFLLLLGHTIYHRFLNDLREIRRKAGLGTIFHLLSNATHEDIPDSEVRRFAEAHPEVKVIEAGHSHCAGIRTLRVGEREVACFNTGTGIEQIRLKKPEFAGLNPYVPRLEAFFRRIGFYWKERPYRAVGLVFIHSMAAATPFAAERLFGWMLEDLVWIVPLLAVFSLLMRQSYALYADETYVEYTPIETKRYADGRRERALMQFHPSSGSFDEYVPENFPLHISEKKDYT